MESMLVIKWSISSTDGNIPDHIPTHKVDHDVMINLLWNWDRGYDEWGGDMGDV